MRHTVDFYSREGELGHSVAEFITEDKGRTAVITTQEHRGLFTRALVERGALPGPDWLRFLDAEQTLAGFVDIEGVNEERFGANMASLSEWLGPTGRIYDEMVALLWNSCDVASTVSLERCWNDLLADRGTTLLCAYPDNPFHGEHSGAPVTLCALISGDAEAALRAILHEVAVGRVGYEHAANGVAMVSALHPEILRPEVIEAFAALYSEVVW